MSRASSMLGRTLFSTVGIYTEYLIGLLVSVVIARHLQPSGFGEYSIVVWLVAMGVVVANSGTATAGIKFVAELRGSGETGLLVPMLAYLRRIQHWFLLAVVGLMSLAVLLMGAGMAQELHRGWLLAFLAASVVVRSQYMLNVGVAKGFENFRALAVVALVSAPLNLLMVLAAGRMGASIEVFLGIFLLSGMVLLAVSQWQVARMLPPAQVGAILPPPLLARIRRHVRFTAATVSLGFLVGSEIEMLFLKRHAGEDMAGQFKVAYQLSIGATQLVPGVFSAILLPLMAGALRHGADVAARRFVDSTRYLMLLAAPLVAFGVVFCGQIVALLYGPAYAPAASAFAVCLGGLALMALVQGASSLLISADRQGSILLLQIGLAVAKLVADALLIQRYGLDGAALAFWLVALLDAGVIMALAIRVSGAAPGWRQLSMIALAAVGAALATLPLRGRLPLPLEVLAGGGVLLAAYLLLTFVLGGWSRHDIERMHGMSRHVLKRRVPALDSCLDWARQRAST
ncbi:MAG: oligosaccharide flippase family protein [Pseudoxanthomonas sp.]